MDDVETELNVAWREGFLAYLTGTPYNDAPYDDDELNEAWREGWKDSQSDV